MPRGSGDHHKSTPPASDTRIGNIPWRYALTIVAGSRSPPTATRSPSGSREGWGSSHRLAPTGFGEFERLTAKLQSGRPEQDQRGGQGTCPRTMHRQVLVT